MSPYPAPPCEPAELPRLHRPDGRPWTVLLADDNAVNLALGVALLEELGLQVRTARDGQDALARFAEGGIDLVLMDVQMPRMDGLQATRALRAQAGSPPVPVIAMTANSFDSHCADCRAAGMNDLVAKPVDIWRLVDALRRWLPAA